MNTSRWIISRKKKKNPHRYEHGGFNLEVVTVFPSGRAVVVVVVVVHIQGVHGHEPHQIYFKTKYIKAVNRLTLTVLPSSFTASTSHSEAKRTLTFSPSIPQTEGGGAQINTEEVEISLD